MKSILTVSIVLMLFAGVFTAAAADGVLDLSTLGKKSDIQPVSLPMSTPSTPSYSNNYLGSQNAKDVLDLSTLGKKKIMSDENITTIKGSGPITITPSFSIVNTNLTSTEAATIFTMPQAISANPIIFTPPIALFGGA
jgi:hypothetical protein